MTRRTLPGFALVGATGFLVDAALLAVCLAAGLDAYSSRAVSVVIAIVVTWYLNRRLVFNTRGQNKKVLELSRHFAAQSLGTAINIAVYIFVLKLLPGSSPIVALIAGSAVALVFNYLMAKHWTFQTKEQDSNARF